MTNRLETLKAEHPEWCWSWATLEHLIVSEPGATQRIYAQLAALVAMLQQHEATIAELKDGLRIIRDCAAWDRRQCQDAISQAGASLAEAIRLMQPPPMYLTESESVGALNFVNQGLQAELAKAKETIQQQARDLEEADRAVIAAHDALREPFEPEQCLGCEPASDGSADCPGHPKCEVALSFINTAHDAALARQSARSQQAENKEKK